MRKKLIFMIWALEVGGAERFLVKLLKNLSQELFEIKVVCISRKGVWAEEVEHSGIPVVSMDKRTGIDPLFLFRLMILLHKEKPDLVNLYLWTAYFWGGLAAHLVGVKHIIVTEQNLDIWKRWYHKFIDKILMRWMERVVCVSDQVAEFYKNKIGVPENKIRMIPNAIDLTMFSPSQAPTGLKKKLEVNKDSFLFVCAARLHEQKAHHILIKAVDILVQRGVEGFHLIIVGEGELRELHETDVRRKNLSRQISFLGLRQDIPDIFQQSDCLVLSSDYEGLSLAILEAMAARLPVVATDVGGNAQVVSTGNTGILVPAQRPGLLADAMQAMIEDSSKAKVMGAEGRAYIEQHFAIEKIAQQTTNLFVDCLKGNQQ